MQKHDFKKSNNGTIKWVVTTIILVTTIIGGSFISGTFYPNSWTVDKIEDEFHKKELSQVQLLGLTEPEFEYTDKATFLTATKKCVEYLNYTTDRMSRVPTSIIISMAGIESGWGTSRFATEGNALFGVRTWSLDEVPHMKPAAIPNAKFGVKKYETKCQSVSDVIDIINRHPAYKEFRAERDQNKYEPNITKMVFGLSAWSTNEQYPQIILRKIEELTNQ